MIVLNDKGKLEIISLKLMNGKDRCEAATLLIWSGSVPLICVADSGKHYSKTGKISHVSAAVLNDGVF